MTLESGTPLNVYTEGGGGRDGMFGGDGAWWILVLFLFAGFGRGGGYSGFAGGGGDCQTRASVADGFAINNIQSGIQAIQQGICDSTYALTNAINGGFNGVERGFYSLSSQFADCCCQTQRAIDGVNYNMAKNTCDLQNTMNNNTRDIIENQNANSRAILDFLTQSKIDALRDENQALRFSASQDRQNALLTTAMTAQTTQILGTLNPAPVPAYVVQNPNCCTSSYGGYGGWGGCGCSG